MFAYAAAVGVTLRVGATEIWVRRPRAGRPGRKGFVSGKVKQNTIEAMVVADDYGATLWCGGYRPGRMHDTTAVRVEGIHALLDAHPQLQVLVDAGHRGLAKIHPCQATAPPWRLGPGTPPARQIHWEAKRKHQSSHRIAVEHATAELRW